MIEILFVHLSKMFLKHVSLKNNLHFFVTLSDVPDAPGKPVVEDITPEGASLTWTPPPKDGGAPITEYKVQKRKRGDTKWDDVITPEPITDCICKVMVLILHFFINKWSICRFLCHCHLNDIHFNRHPTH